MKFLSTICQKSKGFNQVIWCKFKHIIASKQDLTLLGIIDPITFNEILEGSREDIYLMKHLRGNTNWHFQAMANLNDVDISFEYFETDSGAPLPADLAFNLIGNGEFQLKIIFWNQEEGEELPAKIPFLLGTNPTCLKLQKLYNEFKPAPNELIFEFQNGIPPLERIKLDFKK